MPLVDATADGVPNFETNFLWEPKPYLIEGEKEKTTTSLGKFD